MNSRPKYRARSPVIALRLKRGRFAVFLLTEPGIYRTRPLDPSNRARFVYRARKVENFQTTFRIRFSDADALFPTFHIWDEHALSRNKIFGGQKLLLPQLLIFNKSI